MKNYAYIACFYERHRLPNTLVEEEHRFQRKPFLLYLKA